jgi:isopentenyl-diphosphate delta-isomerase
MEEEIILVDKKDKKIGSEFKLKAHKEGKLHRAFSIFVFNSRGELLLQKRALGKYHSGGLWTNTCCSHPNVGETVLDAGHRRLKEEMGFDCELSEKFSFIYKAKLDNELTEYEFDHVLFGKFDGIFKINSKEAEDVKWINLELLTKEMKICPQQYTYWFKKCYNKILTYKE